MRIMWSSIIENDHRTVFVYDAVKNFVKRKQLFEKSNPTFAAVAGFRNLGIKREVRCKSGAIPVAVSSWIVNGEYIKNIDH